MRTAVVALTIYCAAAIDLAPGVPRIRCPRMETDLQYRRRIEGRKPGWQTPPPAQEPDTAASIVEPGDFDGTRQGVARARRAAQYRASASLGTGRATNGPPRATNAQDSLDASVREASCQAPAVARASLSRAVDDASSAGISPRDASMMRAAALLQALEAADALAVDEERPALLDQEQQELDSKLDAIFGEGYCIPGELDGA